MKLVSKVYDEMSKVRYEPGGVLNCTSFDSGMDGRETRVDNPSQSQIQNSVKKVNSE